jgi:hypothetical protein
MRKGARKKKGTKGRMRRRSEEAMCKRNSDAGGELGGGK